MALFFASEPSRQGILARRELGRPAADEDELIERLVEEISEAQAVETAVVPTIWRAHELLDLEACDEHVWRRVIEFILGLQGRRGAFDQGCSRIRHSHRICEHFISGFFSPAPPEQRVTPIMFPNGKVFRAEPAGRFALSCLALRAALRAGLGSRPLMERHIASLLRLQQQWTDWRGYFAGDAIVAGIHALACGSPPRELRARLSSLIAAQQRPDGTWANADLFHTLEALLALGTPEAREAVRRSVPALLSRQRLDGSFGSTAQQERALIALRALLWAEPES